MAKRPLRRSAGSVLAEKVQLGNHLEEKIVTTEDSGASNDKSASALPGIISDCPDFDNAGVVRAGGSECHAHSHQMQLEVAIRMKGEHRLQLEQVISQKSESQSLSHSDSENSPAPARSPIGYHDFHATGTAKAVRSTTSKSGSISARRKSSKAGILSWRIGTFSANFGKWIRLRGK